MSKRFVFFSLLLLAVVFSSCSVFRKKTRHGCPTSGAAIGAERILEGEKGVLKKSQRSKFKVKNTIY